MKTLLPILFFALARGVVMAQVTPISEDFTSNKRAWPVDEIRTIQNGVYVLNSPEEGLLNTINFFFDDQSDYEISIDLKQLGGMDGSIYGLVWSSGLEQTNVFLISPSGYLIASGPLGEWKGWKKTKAVQPESNSLKIQKTDGRELFFINDIKVEERKPAPYFGHWAGILTMDQMKLEADNFYFKQSQAEIRLDNNFSAFKKENLGDRVNSIHDDLGPIISTDGKTLFFARQRVPENVGGEKDDEDVWYSKFEKGLWGFGRNMGKPINSSAPDNLVAVGSDNNTMLFNLPDGLAFRYRSQNGWSDLEKLNLGFQNESHNFVGTLSSDGRALIFSAMLKSNLYYDSRREENDLFVSLRDSSGLWSAPINIGPAVNTPGEESSPFLTADGQTLFFASNGRPGYGDLDIFVVQRKGEGWKEWSEPLNLGPTINSPAFDAYYTIPASGNYAYLVSYDGGFGGADIFRVKLSESVRPRPVFLVHGKVYNKKTMLPVGSSIFFEDLSTGKRAGEARSDPKTGDYQIVLPSGSKYGFMARSEGFFSVRENLNTINMETFKEVDLDLFLVPIEVGEKMKLNNVFFDAGLSTLQRESYAELNNLALLMKQNPSLHIELEGHTDNRGTEDVLQILSEDRIASVKNYLIQRGVDPERMTGFGYGSSRPLAPSDTEENRLKNRRVEFKIIKK
jgi:outer membrane protein OmpA-like peptidoglycan-associated protein